MRRIRLTIAYDGTAFCGFQVQPDARTVEGELNRALSELTGENITVIGASRTDSGVHALGNIAVFDTESTIPAERFPFALLSFLPEDMKVTEGCEVPLSWHPRKQDCIKTYEYVYSCGRLEDPKSRLYAAFYESDPDIDKMCEAAGYLVGEHDFTSFANPSSQILKEGGSAVRTIYSIALREDGRTAGNENRTIRLSITGNGFLYNMVRIIAGTLMNVGTGRWTPEKVAEALSALDRTKAGPTAQARGLTLVSIRYIEGKEGSCEAKD
ncbi:MAG: tRNA pseudouridine(38-40) synthase TruA [Eubacteriales bacterium]|nr:tRNA pseudouridine(38-40) synthase TruA [Eubacteriales bacterium]